MCIYLFSPLAFSCSDNLLINVPLISTLVFFYQIEEGCGYSRLDNAVVHNTLKNENLQAQSDEKSETKEFEDLFER